MTQTFSDFGLPHQLMQALERAKFATPTPVQAQAIPLAMQGHDILGSAQTGTGKTGAFGIPLIAKLMENPDATALILTPTRELAAQVMAALQQWIAVPNIKTALLIGGEPMPKQYRQLQMRPRLIVGTPGRVNDHLLRKTLHLDNTRFLVLDETDRMLDMGFGIQLDAILEYLPNERQTMMFSATLPSNIMKLSAKYLHQPQRIAVGNSNAPATKIRQEMIQTTEAEKYNQLVDQLEKNEGSVIIFVKTKFGADKLATKLCRAEYKADAIHGDLKQNRRDRVIQGFRDKKYRILVATDVAARGLDIPHIEVVINYDMPQAPEDYIHRIGRTARAGAEGYAVNLVAPIDGGKWKAIHRMMNPDAKSDRPERNERPSNGGGQRRSNGGGYNRDFGNNNNKGGFPGFANKSRPAYAGREEGSTQGYARRDDNNEGFARRESAPSLGRKPAYAGGGGGRPSFGGGQRSEGGYQGGREGGYQGGSSRPSFGGQRSENSYQGGGQNGGGYQGGRDGEQRSEGGYQGQRSSGGGGQARAGGQGGYQGGNRSSGGFKQKPSAGAAGRANNGQRRFAKKSSFAA